ncbi:hypothetical protein Hsw_PA0118 (plasmid) [Hymenobacter swuensis DY53]|uniref:Uncharacterized protein n=1 Tax=Hymenobacter swuensis DY53 TaxID=1227739 RepID=W8EYQ7_9BACT|nr:hypothetical protein Hsw_PA0118 [Hymenobacter swuensis DY53]
MLLVGLTHALLGHLALRFLLQSQGKFFLPKTPHYHWLVWNKAPKKL